MNPQSLIHVLDRLQQQVGRVVFGCEDHVRLALIAFAARGHVLVEGPPGTAKTLLARVFARSLGLGLRRLQCTPDLMPGDVLGANIFDFRTQTFHLTKGPVFTEFLLADEINRTPPKTQAALLQAMQERQVTIDGTTHELSRRFFVMATQNPIEHEGTYPLPEAQLDRFLFKLLAGYPSEADELQAVFAHCAGATMPDLDSFGIEPVLAADELEQLHLIPSLVRMEPDVAHYAVALARASREHHALAIGLSPRAATMLAAAARVRAACDGRDYAIPDDVKTLFAPVARHRLVLRPSAEIEGVRVPDVLTDVLESVSPPH